MTIILYVIVIGAAAGLIVGMLIMSQAPEVEPTEGEMLESELMATIDYINTAHDESEYQIAEHYIDDMRMRYYHTPDIENNIDQLRTLLKNRKTKVRIDTLNRYSHKLN